MNTRIQDIRGLSLDAARQCVPSIFATEPMQGVSDRYSFIPTEPIVKGLLDSGLVLTSAQAQIRGRGGKRVAGPHGAHMLRFRTAGRITVKTGDLIPEIVLINSHDRTTRYHLMGGIFRLVCSNGLVIADSTIQSVKILHYNVRETTEAIVAGAAAMGEQLKMVTPLVDRMRARVLSREEQVKFADAAIELRYRGSPTTLSGATLVDLSRREEDRGDDLWRVFNRVQEHLAVGGLNTGKRHTKPMESLHENLMVNRGLWSMATSLLEKN